MSTQIFNPIHWELRHYIFAIGILTSANILGPRGIIQLILLHQEKERLQNDIRRIEKSNQTLRHEISLFKKSPVVRKKALRENLAVLKENEIFVRFVREDGK